MQTTPLESICSNGNLSDFVGKVCCDTANLDTSDQFEIQSSAFTFGILTNNDARMLTFPHHESRYHYEHHRVSNSISAPDATFTISESDRVVNNSLLLLRFIIGNTEYGKTSASMAGVYYLELTYYLITG